MRNERVRGERLRDRERGGEREGGSQSGIKHKPDKMIYYLSLLGKQKQRKRQR